MSRRVRVAQLSNADEATATALGISTLVNLAQFWNALRSTGPDKSGRAMPVNCVQSLNTHAPIVTTFGKPMLVKYMQLWNAEDWMSETFKNYMLRTEGFAAHTLDAMPKAYPSTASPTNGFVSSIPTIYCASL